MNTTALHRAIVAAGLPLVSVESPDGVAIVLRVCVSALKKATAQELCDRRSIGASRSTLQPSQAMQRVSSGRDE